MERTSAIVHQLMTQSNFVHWSPCTGSRTGFGTVASRLPVFALAGTLGGTKYTFGTASLHKPYAL
jgi:hypothetical protein